MAEYHNDINGYIEDKLDGLKAAGEDIGNQMAYAMAKALEKATDGEVEIRQKKSRVEIYLESEEDSMDPADDIIDLKQHFKQSPNRRFTEDGGWYMIIPMRRYTGVERRESSRGMSKGMYEDLLAQRPEGGYAELLSEHLYGNRRAGSMIPELNYTPKSKGITRLPIGVNRHQYITFRTVSDKSHPASWIVNRSKADPKNKSAEVERIIREVIAYNSKQH